MTDFVLSHGIMQATVQKAKGKGWYIILFNKWLNASWTSGRYSRQLALSAALDFISGKQKLPASITTQIPKSKEDYTGTIEQRQRTCSYCLTIYKTTEILSVHRKVCPTLHSTGYYAPISDPPVCMMCKVANRDVCIHRTTER